MKTVDQMHDIENGWGRATLSRMIRGCPENMEFELRPERRGPHQATALYSVQYFSEVKRE